MKKLFSVFAEISILAAPVKYTIGCNPIPDLPYISDNQISENTKKTINRLVLDENSKVTTLFDYNLDTWVKPTFFPKENIMNINIENKDILKQMQLNMPQLKKIHSEENLAKDSLEYMKKILLSSRDLKSQPWPTVVEKYNWYLDQTSKNKIVTDLETLVYYYDNLISEKSDLYDKKRWLYVDQLRSENVKDWFKDAHSWTLNSTSANYNENTKFDQGIFYYVLLNTYLQKVQTHYNVQLRNIWKEYSNQKDKETILNIISPDIAGITLTFTVWDPEKWTKYFVDGHPVVNSNDNVFENLPSLPIEQKIGVKLVVANIYGTVSSYLIGSFVISNLLGIE
ncbi:hypothetical protein [Spiroplasma endosymbiont of Poecilobothrus nobilitatus]|uniref:hypothetical protein n=1 Tax=Spiroplasma endosymbiont of Poecilobothrus nobilitatus TaxID=1209220 RepID=UPI00313C50AB